jgi:hypothetical protein
MHLEPVTPQENKFRSNCVGGVNARKTHCYRGHPLSGENLIPSAIKLGWRRCKECHKLINANQFAKRKAAK